MKSIKRIAKLQFPGAQAKPGPALASLGINIMQFCTQFNSQTQERAGENVPVEITIFTDKSFIFKLKTTPTADLIKKAAKLEKGASTITPGKPIATISQADFEKIAEYKLIDLNTSSLEAAKKIVLGTMKQMGVHLATAQQSETEVKDEQAN